MTELVKRKGSMMEDSSLFKPGAEQEVSEVMAEKLRRENTEEGLAKAKEEMRLFAESLKARGMSNEEVILELWEYIQSDLTPQERTELANNIRAKMNTNIEGAGKQFDLPND